MSTIVVATAIAVVLAGVILAWRGDPKAKAVSTVDTIICNMAVCRCCMLIHANGECCADDDHGGDGREPWSEVDFADGYSVTMGLLSEEHADGCTEADRDEGCDCEGPWFSWSRCDGCGSRLGGNRWAFTLWHRESSTVS